MLRTRSLWAETGFSVVKEDQKNGYKAGLIFVDAVGYYYGSEDLVLTRFDHPMYPYDGSRWAEWLDVADHLFMRSK